MHGRARVAWNLRRLRVARAVSQENLAVDASVDRSSISEIEGGTFNPSIDLLDRLANALEVDVAEFLVVPWKAPSRRHPEARTPTQRVGALTGASTAPSSA